MVGMTSKIETEFKKTKEVTAVSEAIRNPAKYEYHIHSIHDPQLSRSKQEAGDHRNRRLLVLRSLTTIDPSGALGICLPVISQNKQPPSKMHSCLCSSSVVMRAFFTTCSILRLFEQPRFSLDSSFCRVLQK